MKKIFIAALVVAILSVGAGHMLAAPGDSDDPVVTLSYIQNVLMPSISKQIEQQTAPKFEVLNVEKEQKVMCNAGTELILRMGRATVIATQKGGLANVTSGVDIKDGEDMPANSLLIVPLSDGRGVIANNDVILMIKGTYSIE